MNKFLIVGFLLALVQCTQGQQSVNVSGHVEFIDDNFKISAVRYDGFEKIELAVTTVDPTTHNYSLNIPVKEAGHALIVCDKWQQVNVWLEDENMEIDFRGVDTAKVKIKNPPHVHIKAGKNNELMNLANYMSYQNYQSMIAVSQYLHKNKKMFASEEDRMAATSSLFDILSDGENATKAYLVEHYADRNSVLFLINRMNYEKNKSLIDRALERLKSISPSSVPMIKSYYEHQKDQKERLERISEGSKLPDCVFFDVKEQKKLLSDYFGKVIVLDFWASWCGPCRAEIPNMKKIYTDMDKKKVEFLSISIDSKKDDWIKAMKEEAMNWPQGWVADAGKEVMKTYMFNGIPFIMVIDKDGKIFRKNVRGEAIREAVEEALNQK